MTLEGICDSLYLFTEYTVSSNDIYYVLNTIVSSIHYLKLASCSHCGG